MSPAPELEQLLSQLVSRYIREGRPGYKDCIPFAQDESQRVKLEEKLSMQEFLADLSIRKLVKALAAGRVMTERLSSQLS